MRICYIKRAENVDEYINYTNKVNISFIKNIIMKIKKVFNIITVKPIGDGILFLVPYKKGIKIKLADKIAKRLKYYNIDSIAIAENLQENHFINRLYEYNINILDGRWLFKFLLNDIIEYISILKNEKLENKEVTIAVNDIDEITVRNIYEIAEKIKRVNIVTNNIEKFKQIENKLYEEKGIMITVANNKRKSLAKAKIILNIDFSEEALNKYNINKKAIIINIEDKIKIFNKGFNGININYYELEVKDEIIKKFIDNNMHENFNKNILYESVLYSKARYQVVREKITKDKIKLIGLIGNNGMIDEKEFKNLNENY